MLFCVSLYVYIDDRNDSNIFMFWRCVIAQILIQVSIQTHQQSGGEEVVEKAQVVVLLLQVEAPQLKWVLQFQKVLPL